MSRRIETLVPGMHIEAVALGTEATSLAPTAFEVTSCAFQAAEATDRSDSSKTVTNVSVSLGALCNDECYQSPSARHWLRSRQLTSLLHPQRHKTNGLVVRAQH
jgi:hypothetical protein